MGCFDAVLAGKLALVTGGSGGIGSAVARRLAHDGAHVIVHYNAGRDAAEAVAAAIAATGDAAQAIGADLGVDDGPNGLIAQLDAAFGGRFAGRLDVLVNNAGSFAFGSLADTTDGDFDRLFSINVRAMFVLTRAAAGRMTARGGAASSTSDRCSARRCRRPRSTPWRDLRASDALERRTRSRRRWRFSPARRRRSSRVRRSTSTAAGPRSGSAARRTNAV